MSGLQGVPRVRYCKACGYRHTDPAPVIAIGWFDPGCA